MLSIVSFYSQGIRALTFENVAVVVAVLLDNFFKVSQAQQESAEERQKEEERQVYSLKSTPFCERLMRHIVQVPEN